MLWKRSTSRRLVQWFFGSGTKRSTSPRAHEIRAVVSWYRRRSPAATRPIACATSCPKGVERVVSLLNKRFQRAVAEGDLPPECNPADLARFVAAVSHGIAVEAAGGASREQLRRVARLALEALPK